jgi:translation initiation factor IF-3
MDSGKLVVEIKTKVALQKTKQKQTQVKDMKFRPGTDEGDYNIKLRNLIRFLENGDKAKITLRFRGREMAHQQLGMDMMKRIEADLAELAQVEQFPKLEGRQMIMTLAPRSKKK